MLSGELKMDNGDIDLWSTHLPVLVEAVLHTSGAVLELGSGHYSTRVLRALSGAYPDRRFVTCDTNPRWVARFADLRSANHEIVCAADISVYVREAWELVFVDEAPAQHRIIQMRLLRPVTRLFVVNNTEPGRPVYRYEELLPSFPHRWDYKRYPVWTSYVSDHPLPEWVGRSV